jgi:long-subunit fatty acid transport protein
MIKNRLNFTLILIFTAIINCSLFGNGFNLNSIGSRAASMGGAYIGLAVYFPSDLGTKWNGYELINISLNGVYGEWSSRLRVIAICPVLSYRIDKTLSIGTSLKVK